jgi:3',5'-cyclic AMP phosphodiesterase CpdA
MPTDVGSQANKHMLRIAHLSDLHVLSPLGLEWREMLFNKRLTGYANFVWRRGRVHRREYLQAVLAAAAEADHVVVTGDITNLALEGEFKEARRLLDEIAPTAEVTVIPGNHDIYLARVQRDRIFPRHFGPFLQSDLPDLAVEVPAGRYPCVKLRGPAAIIALSSAVPRPPFIAAGYLGSAQLEAFIKILLHPEVKSRTPVILIHHPPVDSRCRLARLRDGLVDGASFRAALAPLERGIVLFGHLHVRVRCMLRTRSGAVDVVGASGAALDHTDNSIRAGFNLYYVDPGGLATVEGYVLDESARSLCRTTITEREGCR